MSEQTWRIPKHATAIHRTGGSENRVLLSVRSLKTCFGSFAAVNGIDFEIRSHETFALIGESGSGKTVAALSVLRLLPPGARIEHGKVLLGQQDLFRIPELEMQKIRGRRIGMIFQDPMTSLNPVMKIGEQIAEAIVGRSGLDGDALKSEVIDLMDKVEIPASQRRYHEYPHQLSGGQRQRAVIAIALANRPDLLIADEPTTALDVTIQAQILKLLKKIQLESGMSLWLITHDFGVVREMADTVAVMQEGVIVESSGQGTFFSGGKHPYTKKLFAALPSIDHFRASKPAGNGDLLDVKDFKVYYPIRKGLFKRVAEYVKAVDGVTFKVGVGRTLALVGESGCGKTTLGKAILRLIPESGGEVWLGGENLAGLSPARLRRKRVEMQMIFQDPFSSMNPRMPVGEVIGEGIRSLHPEMNEDQRRASIMELLGKVGLDADAANRFPHEFSGGQRQRICIARALAVRPRLIVCDEPTSSLDVSVQAQIIDLLKHLQDTENLSYLFISHDLAVVAEMADEVAVMYEGRIVEIGTAAQVLSSPGHEYTRKLLDSVPRLN
ncbi:MAG: dipeptide ABC transporter ATP-binding protein [Methylococcaceae bacterium]|nr:dipeptide ABC transporter ATP-binding protein [Methylococcaceae bacterium]MCI0732714.1 dipeptide ABC transporter ATP-binding protein [Methylococcaceae bacterium]